MTWRPMIICAAADRLVPAQPTGDGGHVCSFCGARVKVVLDRPSR